MTNEFKGFRFGVKEAVCSRAGLLVESIETELVAENERAELTPLELIEIGAVYVNDQRSVNPARLVKSGDKLRIHSLPRRFSKPADLRDRIRCETGESLLVDKPAGLPLDATIDNLKENLISYLDDLRREHLFVVHRLEIESSGPVLLAKNQTARDRMKTAFAEEKVKRTYAVYTKAAVEVGTRLGVLEVLSCEERVGKTSLICEGRVSWTVVGAPIENHFRVEVLLTSGRPHQVREYFAGLGNPILGDTKHGSNISVIADETGRAALASRLLIIEV